MPYTRFFSADYKTARERFRSAVERVGGRLRAYPIAATGPDGGELTIDVGFVGSMPARRVLVVSSGLHGAEGFFGSAVQLALLEEDLSGRTLPPEVAVVLPHGLNPFGFAWRRRCDDANVDLNRNFLLPGEAYEGSPPLYGALDPLFNPPRPPSRFEPFGVKAAGAVLRHGMRALRATLPVGQYEFPRGLFFGGSEPAEVHRIVAEHLADWLAGAEEVLHLDLHTGLGRWATYQLLMDVAHDDPAAVWARQCFGDDQVSAAAPGEQRAVYHPSGSWDRWCRSTLPDCRYRFITAEFGTYPMSKVVAALRSENQAFHYTKPGDPHYEWTRVQMVEAFAPASPRWRDSVVRQGLDLVRRAIEAFGA